VGARRIARLTMQVAKLGPVGRRDEWCGIPSAGLWHNALSRELCHLMPSTLDADVRRATAAAAGGDEKRDYVQQIFSEIAPRYDLLNHVLSLNIDKGWRRRALEALGWTRAPRGTYLDVCAGTLDVGAQLVRQAGFGGYVMAADFAEPMLRMGHGKAAVASLGPVAADALRLPVADGVFDGAIVAFGIRNVAALDAGLREVHRTLRDGARFVILEFSTPRNVFVRWSYQFYFHSVLPLIGRLVSGHKTAYTYLPRSVAHFPVEEELAQRMTAAGFRHVSWTPLSFGIAAIHVGTR
jgi:demethylmenaquinone methyltransferase / 2-methoxy-6-polyprenyl-1,4-benzoquinol methylase